MRRDPVMCALVALVVVGHLACVRQSDRQPNTTPPVMNIGGVGDGCGSDGQCETGLVCEAGTCQVSCRDAAAPDEVCEARLNQPAICQAGRCVAQQVQTGCAFDDECPTDEVCSAEGACVVACFQDVECVGEARCLVREGGAPGRVCRLPDGADTCASYVDGSAFCSQQLGVPIEEALCEAGVCEALAPTTILMVRDVSTSELACNPTDPPYSPGSDIAYLALANAQDELIGWARAVAVARDESQTNVYTSTDHLDGLPLSIDQDGCPEPDGLGESFRADSVVSLGCGGWLAVEFVDDAGRIIALESGMRVEVGEFNGVCDGEPGFGDEDQLVVSLCPGAASGQDDLSTLCSETITAASVSGFQYIELP